MPVTVFGKRLSVLMDQPPKTTRKQLAEYLNVTYQCVCAYLSGTSVPGAEAIVAIADYFGVTTDYLLREDVKQMFRKDSAPRMCSILGHPVGELFRVKDSQDVCYITQDGEVYNGKNKPVPSAVLAAIINDPDSITPCPEICLTEDKITSSELSLIAPLIRDMGIYWITRDDTSALADKTGLSEDAQTAATLSFWSSQPSVNKKMQDQGCVVYEGAHKVGSLSSRFFPSFKPGACFYSFGLAKED